MWRITTHYKPGEKTVSSYYNFKTRKIAGAGSVSCAMNRSKHSATQLGWVSAPPSRIRQPCVEPSKDCIPRSHSPLDVFPARIPRSTQLHSDCRV